MGVTLLLFYKKKNQKLYITKISLLFEILGYIWNVAYNNAVTIR